MKWYLNSSPSPPSTNAKHTLKSPVERSIKRSQLLRNIRGNGFIPTIQRPPTNSFKPWKQAGKMLAYDFFIRLGVIESGEPEEICNALHGSICIALQIRVEQNKHLLRWHLAV